MKNNKKLLLLILLLVAISVALVGSAFADNKSQEVTFYGEEVESEYGYYSEFVAPLRFVKLSGNEYVANSVITFPSGKATSYGRAILNELGEYTIVYTAKIDGVSYTDTHKFNVSIAPKDLWTGDTAKFKTYNNADVNPIDEKGAVLLSAYAKTEMRYLNEVYLGDNTANDDVITFVVKPAQRGNAESKTFYVVIEDSSNSSNRIYVKFHRKSYELLAERYTMTVSVGLDGENFTEAQTITESSMCGRLNDNSDSKPVTVALNSKSGIIRVTCNSNKFEFDLTKEIVVGSGITWKGLSNGWAYVYAGFKNRLTSGASSVAIYSVDGISLGGDEISTAKKPDVTIMSDKLVTGVIYAAEGSKHIYPEAKAVCGVEGNLNIAQVNVFKVNGSIANTVNAGIDGFIPEEAGTYRVEYVTEDNYLGMHGSATYELIVLSKEECAINFTFGDYEESYVAGQKIAISDHTVTGGRGDISVTYEATVGNKRVDIIDGEILADYVGEYTLKAICTDDVQVSEYTKILSCSENNEKYIDIQSLPAVIVAGDSIDFSIVDAYKYTTSGKTSIAKTVKVDGTVVNGKYTFNTVGSKVITIDAEGKEESCEIEVVKPDSSVADTYIKGYFDLNGATSEITNTGIKIGISEDKEFSFARAIGVNSFYLKFKVFGADANFNNMEITLTDSAKSGNAVSFSLSKGSTTTPKVSVLTYMGKTYEVDGGFINAIGQFPFTLSYDNAEKALFDGDESPVVVFDKTTSNKPFNGFEGDIYLSIKLNGVTKASSVIISNIANQSIAKGITETTKNAGPDIVFTETFQFGNVNEKYALKVPAVYDVLDSVASVSVSVKDPNGKEVLNTSISGASFTPTAKGDYTATYTAVDASGNKNELKVAISIIDESSEDLSVGGVGVNTSDKESPKIAIGPKVTTAKVGEKFSIAKISVSDNLTATNKIKLYVYVIAPDGVRTLICCTPTKMSADDKLKDSEKRAFITDPNSGYLGFTATYEGSYRVYYVATDGNNLTTIAHYNVEIHE